ncbi:hypothetical protein EHS25_007532 [Saitozyma podzolica]|uniref:Uncharacterized protein n=1 Tax=Saitozyma podzolica TaxID=1890683 RepID=A0A427YQ35_9TREE|nr:hypothetical protein EHS25_007532 [Saitozyma podzolica]
MARRSPRLALLILSALTFLSLASAKSGWGEACSQNNTHLDPDSWALVTDCDATTYCNANGTCAYKGCRKDIYPYGYNGVGFDSLPPLCGDGYYCPDEMDQCLAQQPVGHTCQKDRDDECQPPSNWLQLSGYLNVNGSVCLNFTCLYANVSVGQTCQTENTAYTGSTDSGATYTFVVSRDNCENGLYCDGTALQCMKQKEIGVACTGNKECLSYNCLASDVCGRAADSPITPAAWVYVLVALGIIGFIAGIMVGLWFLHRKSREENQIKLEQYYNEQLAYRQSIMSMSHAKDSLLALPTDGSAEDPRRTLHDPSYAYTSQTDLQLPPNMRRESSAAWSEVGDSEVLLFGENNATEDSQSHSQPRWRG